VEIRAGRVAERQGIPTEEALEIVESKDRSREEYYNYYTFGNWGMASNYDLCIDSSILGIEGTAEHIINFARNAGLL
jgi:cytidylate kinase